MPRRLQQQRHHRERPVLDERPDLGQHGSRRGRVALGQMQPDQGKAREQHQRRRVPELARGGQPFGRQRPR
ncbi:MAG TPA: hypothetical protein VF468_12185 [Actinomycetota bacterium]|nr:hypothetical protein [Actinomycetota bacterium]